MRPLAEAMHSKFILVDSAGVIEPCVWSRPGMLRERRSGIHRMVGAKIFSEDSLCLISAVKNSDNSERTLISVMLDRFLDRRIVWQCEIAKSVVSLVAIKNEIVANLQLRDAPVYPLEIEDIDHSNAKEIEEALGAFAEKIQRTSTFTSLFLLLHGNDSDEIFDISAGDYVSTHDFH